METIQTIEYFETEPFKKDLKKLLKKYRSLTSDLEVVKRDAIELFHLKKVDSLSIFPIPGFCSDEILICKIKKFACKTLKGKGSRSGIRVIYSFFIKTLKVEFLEIYYKGNQELEDKERIKDYLKNIDTQKI